MGRTEKSIDEIEILYRQYGAALLLYAASISGDRGLAQDALHQVFVKLIESGNLDQVFDKKAYLFACVRNTVLNNSRIRERNTPLELGSLWFCPPDRDYAGEQNLRRALNALPEDQREVTVLHIWGELTFSEVAELLSISANTAASRYRYALSKLRGSLFAKEDSCANSR